MSRLPQTGAGQHVVVVGGGLAGLAAALECADRGARVTLLERRHRLGGLTWSFRHADRWIDNGQHVFLRCCAEYLSFLDRIDAASDVLLPDRLDIPVIAPPARPGSPPRLGRLRRSDLPAPLHLLGSLLRFPHLGLRDRLGLGRAVLALRRLDLRDPALDKETFGFWLARHGQSPAAVAALWDLITVPTVNLPAAEASLAMAAKVFQTGLLSDTRAADIGWSRVPLGQLHGERAGTALARAGVDVRLGASVEAVRPVQSDRLTGGVARFEVTAPEGAIEADAVVVAVPHEAAGRLLPVGSVPYQDRLGELGTSGIVDIHLVFDRPVTRWPLLAGLDSPVQWVFDRTASSGLMSRPAHQSDRRSPQYVAVSVSAADDLLGRHPEQLVPWITAELGRLLPEVTGAVVLDSLVTKERQATFRAQPGTAALRPGPRTARPGLAVAGAWTDTGWPATMEGAVRSGRTAAEVAIAGARGNAAGAGAGGRPSPPAGAAYPTGSTAPKPWQATHTEEVA
jgi:squalene-associated FAD-dependent desaturase